MDAERLKAIRGALVLVTVCSSATGASFAKTLTFTPAKDNTLCESADGGVSNGAGPSLFAGLTRVGAKRRALLQFNLADSIPMGSLVDSVTLRLHVNKTRSGPQTMTLHRILANWGESGSQGGGSGGGQGGQAQDGDATWLHAFFSTALWATPGGDFVSTASAQTSVGFPGTYVWRNTIDLMSDVQAWVDAPAANFGWILLGNEAVPQSAKRFDSRESASAALRPTLTVHFTGVSAVESRTWSSVKALYRKP